MSNENSTEEFKILYNDFDREAEAQKQWNELRKLDKDEYKEALETANLLAAIGEAIQTELEEELDYEDIMSIMY